MLARHEFGNIERDTPWTEFSALLQPESSDPRARFVLSFEGKGKLQVDWVSLFPPTFNDRPNGLRRDLATYIEDYRPDFIRYPGGCYVQGISWESAP